MPRRGRSGLVGLIANPAAGKDVRRLLSGVTTTGHATKAGMCRRAVLAAVEAGAGGVVAMSDAAGIARHALHDLRIPLDIVAGPAGGGALETTRAAQAMAEAGCRAVLVLGGDGTNRAVAEAWPDAPIMAVSTGTNNVFPASIEATVAGAAAGLVASGAVGLDEVARRCKTVRIRGSGHDTLALVDLALVCGAFAGAGAMWEPGALRVVVAAIAEPHSVGLSAIAGLMQPCGRDEEGGVALWLDPSAPLRLRVPMIPGLFADVGVTEARRLSEGEQLTLTGPGMLALDGEREHAVLPGEAVQVSVSRDGPWVIDAAAALRLAAERGVFVSSRSEVSCAG